MNYNILFFFIIFNFVKLNHAIENSSAVQFSTEDYVTFHLSTTKDNTYKIANAGLDYGYFFKGNPEFSESTKDVNAKTFDLNNKAVVSSCGTSGPFGSGTKGKFSITTYDNVVIETIYWDVPRFADNNLYIDLQDIKKTKHTCTAPSWSRDGPLGHIYISCYYVDV